MRRQILTCLFLLCGSLTAIRAGAAESDAARPPAASPSAYARWQNGPSTSSNFFPIAVWLQNPWNAARYKEAGINLYVGLWEGPTSEQLARLQAEGMPVICGQNALGLSNRNNPIIVGWMHGDEPDNAQGIPGLRRYGPPVSPGKVVAEYERLRAADPTRPVLLNLGQGVAWDNYIGRGNRRNHPEDYPQYIQGADIASFDIYPAAHDSPEIFGKLEYVAHGVARLVSWSGPERVVWNCIECGQISNPPRKATPDQVRSEVWMSLIHGSRGLIYFVHQFKPTFNESALLSDPEMFNAVAAINRQIHELAPVLNSPSVTTGVTVRSAPAGESPQPVSPAGQKLEPIAWMQKRGATGVYLCTVNMRNEPRRGRFVIEGLSAGANVDVLGEDRRLTVKQGEFADEFKPYQVHLYRISR